MTKAVVGTVAAVALSTIRTQEQIVERMNTVRERDIFGFEWPEYLGALDFEHAKPFLKPGTTAAAWNKVRLYKDTQSVISTMKGYMTRAWKNANAKQGVNTVRSLMHYQAWIWLLGEDEFLTQFSQTIPQPYGKDALNLICQKFGFKSGDDHSHVDAPSSDDTLSTDDVSQNAVTKLEAQPAQNPSSMFDAFNTIDIGDGGPSTLDGAPATENDALAALLQGIGGSGSVNLEQLLSGLGGPIPQGDEGDDLPVNDDEEEGDERGAF